MTNTLTNIYVASKIKEHQIKNQIIDSIQNTPTKYLWKWVVLAVVAMVVAAVAHNTCVRNGYRGFGGSWNATATSGRFNIGCLR